MNSAERSGDEAAVGPPDRPDPKPVSEKPCAERVQPRILPLLGKPYFSCVICKSHVRPPFQVVVPKSLAPFLPSSTAPATVTWHGRSWEMRFTGGRQIQRLEAGWRAFALDNGLSLGDGCVFELVDGATEGGVVAFRVQVLRADIPAAIRERAGGYTSSSPIVID
uniref:TF-B3 domain-containing protein n=1 Tax=Arundo donax TaxID=35708 RepID=A0A0A9HBU5_ARUDO